MADKQIRIDITAEDDASKTLDEVAELAEELEKAEPEITVTADTTTAAGDIQALVDDIEALPSPTIEIGADTSAAAGDIAKIGEDVQALSRADTEIILRAKIDDARGQLKALRDDLGDTAAKARTVDDDMGRIGSGPVKTRALSDLSAGLGDVSGQIGTIADTFEGLGDITEQVAGKVGLDASKMVGAIGGIGFAIGLAAGVWSYFRQKQEEAKRKQQELIDKTKEFQDLLEQGDYRKAAEELVDLYGDAFDSAKNFGLSVQEVTDYITGQRDEMPTAEAKIRQLQQAYEDGEISARDLKLEVYALTANVDEARQSYQDANGTLREQRSRLNNVEDALRGVSDKTGDAAREQAKLRDEVDRTKDAFDKLEGALDMERAFLNFETDMAAAMESAQGDANLTDEEILDIKQSILDVAAAAKLTPIQVKALLEKVDEGNLAYVQRQVEAAWNSNKPDLQAQFVPPTQADIDRIKADMRARFGSFNVPVEVVPRYRDGQSYTGPR